MKGSLANNGRCPKCTLKPPCKHFPSIEALNASFGNPTPVKEQNLNFYEKQSQSASHVTQSEFQSKYQRSDGFSISSQPQTQNGSNSIFQQSANHIMGGSKPPGSAKNFSMKKQSIESEQQPAPTTDKPQLETIYEKKPETLAEILAQQDQLQREMKQKLEGVGGLG